MQCAPSLDQVEGYSVEFLRLILTAHGIRFNDRYDRYDLLALALLALHIDCPRYSPDQVERIRSGVDVPESDASLPPVVARLIPLQRKCVDEMLAIARRHYVLLNGSDPGSGKTIMSEAFSVLAGKSAYVITKRNIVPSWMKTFDLYGLSNVVGLTSYDLGIRGKEYELDARHEDGSWKAVHVVSRHVTRTKTRRRGGARAKRDVLTWKGLENTVIIFDEPHNSKNKASYAHELLISCFEFVKRESGAGNVLLLLGATPADKVANLEYLETVLELKKNSVRRAPARDEDENDTPFLRLNRILYDPEDPRAARVSKDELEAQLGISPPVTVTIQAYAMSKNAERTIEEQNQRIADLIRGLNAERKSTKLVEILRARQIIELQKVPTFVNLAQDALKRGRSVIVFCEFYESTDALAEELRAYKPRLLTGHVTVGGKQRTLKLGERQRLLDDFQEGKYDLLIAHHAIAREGVNMQDTVGGHPRTVLISPAWSGISFVQVLGRADRLCRLSDTEQFVIYAQSTDPSKPGWDARVAEVMISKLNSIKQLNLGEEAASEFMRDLYARASKMKRVSEHIQRTVKLSGTQLRGPTSTSPERERELEAEAEFLKESGLIDEPGD